MDIDKAIEKAVALLNDKTEISKLWQEVVANRKRLTGCAGPHVWEIMTDSSREKEAPNKSLRTRYRCKLCGGDVNAVDRYWYEQGLAHGRK